MGFQTHGTAALLMVFAACGAPARPQPPPPRAAVPRSSSVIDPAPASSAVPDGGTDAASQARPGTFEFVREALLAKAPGTLSDIRALVGDAPERWDPPRKAAPTIRHFFWTLPAERGTRVIDALIDQKDQVIHFSLDDKIAYQGAHWVIIGVGYGP